MSDVKIESSWKEHLNEEFEKAYFKELTNFVRLEYSKARVYPPAKLIFNAFNLCPFDKLKVVIIGQDPYHGAGQAHGLCFSVPDGVRKPPSLVNIFKEIKADTGKEQIPKSGNLESWAKQGVLMINAILTVRAGNPASHRGKGWEQFTDTVIKTTAEQKENLVFLLWGAFARKKKELIPAQKHLILESAHPSPFSANKGFFGNKHFSKTNQFLKRKGIEEIKW